MTSRLSQSLWNAEATRNWPKPIDPRWLRDADAEAVRRLVEELDAAIMEVTSNG
jgi:hypothetical protein